MKNQFGEALKELRMNMDFAQNKRAEGCNEICRFIDDLHGFKRVSEQLTGNSIAEVFGKIQKRVGEASFLVDLTTPNPWIYF